MKQNVRERQLGVYQWRRVSMHLGSWQIRFNDFATCLDMLNTWMTAPLMS